MDEQANRGPTCLACPADITATPKLPLDTWLSTHLHTRPFSSILLFLKQDPALDFTTQPLPNAQALTGKPGLEGAREQQASPILRSSCCGPRQSPTSFVSAGGHTMRALLSRNRQLDGQEMLCPCLILRSPSFRSSPSRQRGRSLQGSSGLCLGGRALPS